MPFIGTICTGACLAPHKRVRIHGLHEVVPKLLQQSPSLADLLLRRRPTCDDMRFYFILNDSIKDSI
jgi:hypothetical protein